MWFNFLLGDLQVLLFSLLGIWSWICLLAALAKWNYPSLFWDGLVASHITASDKKGHTHTHLLDKVRATATCFQTSWRWKGKQKRSKIWRRHGIAWLGSFIISELGWVGCFPGSFPGIGTTMYYIVCPKTIWNIIPIKRSSEPHDLVMSLPECSRRWARFRFAYLDQYDVTRNVCLHWDFHFRMFRMRVRFCEMFIFEL